MLGASRDRVRATHIYLLNRLVFFGSDPLIKEWQSSES